MLVPGVAQPAIQEGKYVADVIRRRVAGRAQPGPFWYWDKSDLTIVDRTYAVADSRFSASLVIGPPILLSYSDL
jgi:NADH:quinone reductase (non-electrogenic)